MSTAPRRSARIAAQPTATRHFPCGHVSKIPRQSQKPAYDIYNGLTPEQIKQVETDRMHMRALLKIQEHAVGTVNRADKAIAVYEYMYANNLILLRSPNFRTVLLDKLNETHNDVHTMAKITLAQRDALNVLYGRITELLRHIVKDPLYVA